MLSIPNAVTAIVNDSEFAKEGLRSGLLNISAYAKKIRPQVENATKKTIRSDGAIVMALSRYAKQLQAAPIAQTDFMIHNLVTRFKLTEIAYTKTADIQERLATLYLLDSVKSAKFFVATTGLAETAIITDSKLAETILQHFGATLPLIRIDDLASLTMQVGIETINMSGQSYAVLQQLAIKNIPVVEYTTSPTELNVIVHATDAPLAFEILQKKFLA